MLTDAGVVTQSKDGQRRPCHLESEVSHLPIIRMTCDFDATPAQLMGAHLEPELFIRRVGPNEMATKILEWDATTGGHWRYVVERRDEEYGFHGWFHEVGEDHIVQTLTFDGQPDGVALETLRFEALGNGRTRLHAQSLVDSFEGRDQWLASGMETGVERGYSKLDALIAALR
jgi:uncharacterized protein YndB with AHSA1/START domain